LLTTDAPVPLLTSGVGGGRMRRTSRLRGLLSRFFFEDRLIPQSPADVESASERAAHAAIHLPT